MATVETLEIKLDFRHIPVSSRNILSVAWDSHILEVKFRTGYTYRYFNVSEQIYRDLIDPDLKISKGIYLKKAMRDKRYVRV